MQDEDVISPDLPPEPEVKIVRTRVSKEKANRAKRIAEDNNSSGIITRKTKKQRSPVKSSGPPTQVPITLKFKIPPAAVIEPAPIVREKEVDSDGDTVGEWSGNEDAEDGGAPIASGSGFQSPSRTNTLTPLSSPEPTPPRRRGFPARPRSPS